MWINLNFDEGYLAYFIKGKIPREIVEKFKLTDFRPFALVIDEFIKNINKSILDNLKFETKDLLRQEFNQHFKQIEDSIHK